MSIRDQILKAEATMRAHHNRGVNGYAYSFNVVGFPRIAFMDIRHDGPALKKARKIQERVWLLDGVQVESLDAAIAGLASTPALTDEERDVLAFIPLDWTDSHNLRDQITCQRGGAAEIEDGGAMIHCERHPIRSSVSKAFHFLRDKGFIEYQLQEVGGLNFLGEPKTRSFVRRRA